jgi:hypothetical protein
LGRGGGEPAELGLEAPEAFLEWPASLVSVFARGASKACAFRKTTPITVRWSRGTGPLPRTCCIRRRHPGR